LGNPKDRCFVTKVDTWIAAVLVITAAFTFGVNLARSAVVTSHIVLPEGLPWTKEKCGFNKYS